MKQDEISKILKVGVQLSAERDLNKLLEQILTCVMELANCDGGTLYLLDQDALHFKIMRNHTLNIYSGGDGQEPEMPPVPLNKENMCALALLEGRTIHVADVKNSQEYDFSGHIRYDGIRDTIHSPCLRFPCAAGKGKNWEFCN